MAATVNTSTAMASLMAATLVGDVTNSSTLNIYSGDIPASPETAVDSSTQVLLATITFPSSSAFSNSDGTLTAATTDSTTITTSGTAGWARWVESDGSTVIADFNCDTSSDDGAVVLPTLTLVENATLSVSSFTYTVSGV